MDVGLEVGLGIFRVLEVDQAIEIKCDIVVVHLEIALKQVLCHGAVEGNHVNILP